MITQIGIAAGEVWHYLDSHGKTKLDDLFSQIEKPRELLLMSVGWLAREGHVILNKEDEAHYLTLRKKEG